MDFKQRAMIALGMIKLEFATAKLEDGTEISYDKLEVDGKLTVKDADGKEVPAPVGEHKLEDGTVIVVSTEGVIAEVKPAEVKAAEDKPEEVKPAEPTTEVKPDELIKTVDDLTKRVEDLEAVITALIEDQTKMKSDFSKQTERVDFIASLPADNSVYISKVAEKSKTVKPLTIQEKIIESQKQNVKILKSEKN